MFPCCASCDGELKGKVYGIQPTLCCADCCKEFVGKRSKHYSHHLVSFSRAIHLYDLTAYELRRLSFKTAANPVEPFGKPMRLYLGAEIAYLNLQKKDAYIRDAMIERVLRSLEERQAIEEKKDHLQHHLCVSFKDIDAVLRCYILGDYLKKSIASTTLADVQKRLEVLERVQIIRSDIKDAHPGAVFDFCMDYPNGTVDDFLDLQRRCYMVFYSQGNRILDRLSEEDRASLTGLSLKKVMAASRTSTMADVIHWKPDKSATAFYRRFRRRCISNVRRNGTRRSLDEHLEASISRSV